MRMSVCILFAIFYLVFLISLIHIGTHSNWLVSFENAFQPGMGNLNAFNWTIAGDEIMEFEPSDSEFLSTTIQLKHQNEIEDEDNGKIERETNGSLFPTTQISVFHLDSRKTENKSETTQPVVNTTPSSVLPTYSERYVEDSKIIYPEKVVYYDWGDQKYGKNPIVVNNNNE